MKDVLAEHWIKTLLARAHEEQQRRITTARTADVRLKGLHGEERAEVVITIKKEIQEELLDWLVQQPKDSYDKLPSDSRKPCLARNASTHRPHADRCDGQHYAHSCGLATTSILSLRSKVRVLSGLIE